VEQTVLHHLPAAHHRRNSPLIASMKPLNQLPASRSTPNFFNTIGQKRLFNFLDEIARDSNQLSTWIGTKRPKAAIRASFRFCTAISESGPSPTLMRASPRMRINVPKPTSNLGNFDPFSLRNLPTPPREELAFHHEYRRESVSLV
ncbi:MAG: hypothetical protein AAF362_21340, partial [Pseudomonadota bacterium]